MRIAEETTVNTGNKFTLSSAKFAFAVHHIKDLPPPGIPEIAFVGRSNVGKSSLLNAICNKKALARVSRTPGRTQALNFFEIAIAQIIAPSQSTGAPSPLREFHHAYLVDLPGYGYAQVSKSQQKNWLELMENYLIHRVNIRAVFLLIDCRRDPKEEELWFIEHGTGGNLFVVLTKADKLSSSGLRRQIKKISRSLKVSPELILISGLVGKKKQDVDKIVAKVCYLLT